MTWGEFKQIVDAAFCAANVDPDAQVIWYIDWSDNAPGIGVTVQEGANYIEEEF